LCGTSRPGAERRQDAAIQSVDLPVTVQIPEIVHAGRRGVPGGEDIEDCGRRAELKAPVAVDCCVAAHSEEGCQEGLTLPQAAASCSKTNGRKAAEAQD
jgi:hypothetical protein